MGLIAHCLQGGGDAWQVASLLGHLHDRRGGERGVAAVGADGATIRTPGVAVAGGEVDTFVFQALQTGHGLLEDVTSTLHQHDDDIRACGGEQRIRIHRGGGVEVFHQCVTFALTEEIVIHDIVGRLLKR